MEVGSYLEIFMTGYGWGFANIMGGTLSATGLVVLPFIWIVIGAWRDAKERGSQGEQVTSLVDAILVKVMTALFVFTLAFVSTPFTSIHHLVYKPRPTVGNPSPAPVSNQGTGSTYDTAMASAFDQSYSIDPQPQLTYVPAWWYAIMSLSSGMNAAVIGSLGNRMNEMRELENALRSTTVSDPRVLQPMQAFRSACYYPAKSLYLHSLNTPTTYSASGLAILHDDIKDLEWMGSQFLLQESGFYDSIRPPFTVNGFAVNCARDREYHACSSGTTPYYQGATMDPEWGRPTCKEWWSTPSTGLRDMMAASAEGRQDISRFANWFGGEKYKDILAKSLQYKASAQQVVAIGSQMQGSDELSWHVKAARAAAGLAAGPKVFTELLTATATIEFLMIILPMVQAIVLLGLYMFLPMATFLSGFDLKVMFLGAIAIFTVKFWTAMWEIAYWIDARLLKAMYPENNNGIAGEFIDAVVYAFEDGSVPGEKRMVLNILLLVMFIGFPMVWTSMMAWAGARIGAGMDFYLRFGGQHGGALGAAGGGLTKNALGSAGKAALMASPKVRAAVAVGSAVKSIRGKK